MPKISVQPVSDFGTREFGEGICDYCNQIADVVAWSLKREETSRRLKVKLCLICMLASVEAATGFGYVNQHRNWSGQSAAMKQAWSSRRKVTKSNGRA